MLLCLLPLPQLIAYAAVSVDYQLRLTTANNETILWLKKNLSQTPVTCMDVFSLLQPASGVVSCRNYSSELSPNRAICNVGRCCFPVLGCTSKKIDKLICQPSHIDSKRSSWVLSSHRNGNYILEASSIEEIYDTLTEHLLQTLQNNWDDSNMKYIIGLAGPPGAGKSTLAIEVVRKLNMVMSEKESKKKNSYNSDDFAIVVPMDGFHLYRSQLDAMEDSTEAHARRGAPWTFDPALLLKCLQTLKNQGTVSFPSFDHGVGDPVEDDIIVNQHHKVVLVEGNYLLLEDDIWRDISSIFNEKWFIEIDIDKSMQRVLNRHISTGKPPDTAKWRIEYNDRPNAELIMKSKTNADLVIKSVDRPV